MRGKQLRNPGFGRSRQLGLAMAAIAVAAALALNGGARAERPARGARLTLENLLEYRDALAVDAKGSEASIGELRDHRQRLQRRRSEIEGNLPPSLRTPRPRLPELPRPRHALLERTDAAGPPGRGPDRLVVRPALQVVQ